MIVTRFLNDC